MMSLLSAFEGLSNEYDVKWFATQAEGASGQTSRGVRATSLQILALPAAQLHHHTQLFCNQTLWPLCHQIFEKPRYQRSDWIAYDAVNRRVAELLHHHAQETETLGESSCVETAPRILVQDYHFARVGYWLKECGFPGFFSLFWHIPWPSWEAFRTLPWGPNLLESLQAFRMVGFHTQEDVDRYHLCLRYTRGTPFLKNGIHLPAGAAPLLSSIDSFPRKRIPHPHHTLLLGVDRADLTKGILERVQAIELLLEKRPELQRSLTLVQIACPTREGLETYRQLAQEIRSQVQRTNQRFQTSRSPSRPVIHLIEKVLSKKTMARLHLQADVMLVTPLHDGMNLVAKEHILTRALASEHPPSALVLSQFAGAIHELPEAIAVNPFSPESICQGIEVALDLTIEEKVRRQRAMAFRLRQWTEKDWARRLSEFTEGGLESSLFPWRPPHATLLA